jgi:hypothetical protein
MYVILDLHWSAPGTTLPSGQGGHARSRPQRNFLEASGHRLQGQRIRRLRSLQRTGDVLGDAGSTVHFCWKNGSTTANGGDCPMVDFAVAGMQELVTTVRQAGANHLVMLGGTGYSSELGLWPTYGPRRSCLPARGVEAVVALERSPPFVYAVHTWASEAAASVGPTSMSARSPMAISRFSKSSSSRVRARPSRSSHGP